MMNDDAYKDLVAKMVKLQERGLRTALAVSDDNADMEITAAHVTAHAASAALLTIALAGTLSAGNREIFVEAINAALASFLSAINTAPKVWDGSEAQGRMH